MFNKCKHDWKVLSEITSDSKIGRIRKNYYDVTGYFSIPELCEKTIIQLVSCTKCGEIKQFVTKV